MSAFDFFNLPVIPDVGRSSLPFVRPLPHSHVDASSLLSGDDDADYADFASPNWRQHPYSNNQAHHHHHHHSQPIAFERSISAHEFSTMGCVTPSLCGGSPTAAAATCSATAAHHFQTGPATPLQIFSRSSCPSAMSHNHEAVHQQQQQHASAHSNTSLRHHLAALESAALQLYSQHGLDPHSVLHTLLAGRNSHGGSNDAPVKSRSAEFVPPSHSQYQAGRLQPYGSSVPCHGGLMMLEPTSPGSPGSPAATTSMMPQVCLPMPCGSPTAAAVAAARGSPYARSASSALSHPFLHTRMSPERGVSALTVERGAFPHSSSFPCLPRLKAMRQLFQKEFEESEAIPMPDGGGLPLGGGVPLGGGGTTVSGGAAAADVGTLVLPGVGDGVSAHELDPSLESLLSCDDDDILIDDLLQSCGWQDDGVLPLGEEAGGTNVVDWIPDIDAVSPTRQEGHHSCPAGLAHDDATLKPVTPSANGHIAMFAPDAAVFPALGYFMDDGAVGECKLAEAQQQRGDGGCFSGDAAAALHRSHAGSSNFVRGGSLTSLLSEAQDPVFSQSMPDNVQQGEFGNLLGAFDQAVTAVAGWSHDLTPVGAGDLEAPLKRFANSVKSKVLGSRSGGGGSERDNVIHVIRPHNGSAPRIIDKNALKKVYHLPIAEAAAQLGLGVTALKKHCRMMDLPRWPYRKIKSMDTMIRGVEKYTAKELPRHTAQDVVKKLECIKEMVRSNPNQEMEMCIKRLRQARYKADYNHRMGLPSRSTAAGNTAAAADVLAPHLDEEI